MTEARATNRDVPAIRRFGPGPFSLFLGEAIDRAILGVMNRPESHPGPAELDRLAAEIAAAHALYGARELLGNPATFHGEPEPLTAPRIGRGGSWPLRYAWLSFPSAYVPDPEDPAASRWGSYERNRTAHAWLLRHGDRSRPYVICVHGMGAGMPLVDFAGFRAAALHQDMGLNLVFPVLPLHGPRQAPGKGVRAFLSFDLLDAFHGFSQAVADVRRLVRWARAEGAERVALYGLSLGAYTAALVATLEDVDLLIAGLPISDVAELFLGHAPADLRAEVETRGIAGAALRDLFALISPLGAPPRVARERRFIFAGSGDRLVPPVHAQRLWRHWERPSISWYAGGHVSFFWAASVQKFVRHALLGFAPS